MAGCGHGGGRSCFDARAGRREGDGGDGGCTMEQRNGGWRRKKQRSGGCDGSYRRDELGFQGLSVILVFRAGVGTRGAHPAGGGTDAEAGGETRVRSAAGFVHAAAAMSAVQGRSQGRVAPRVWARRLLGRGGGAWASGLPRVGLRGPRVELVCAAGA